MSPHAKQSSPIDKARERGCVVSGRDGMANGIHKLCFYCCSANGNGSTRPSGSGVVEQSKSFAATQIERNGWRLEMASEQKERKKQRKEKMRRWGKQGKLEQG